jgi:transcription elongation factor GreA
MNEKEPMTLAGYEKISKELEQLKNVERNKIAAEIATATDHGDLKENAEYHAAKEKQVIMEKRLSLLQDYMGRAQVIDPSKLPHAKVSFGSTVKLLDLETEDEVEYTIVGGVESNVEKGMISYQSPLARMLMGKAEGHDFLADLPNGVKEFEVLEVCYKPFEV